MLIVYYGYGATRSVGGTAMPTPRPSMVQAPEARLGLEICLINWMVFDHLSEIKLIRTDTTLDLSQKAEKVWLLETRRVFIQADAQGPLWFRHSASQRITEGVGAIETKDPKSKTKASLDSRVVPHRSTDRPQRCLVSEIGRDRTFSPWYEP